MHAAIHLDDRRGPLAGALHARHQFVDVELVFDGHRDIRATREQRHEAVDLDAADDLVRHQDRPEPGIRQDFGLTQLRHCDADGTRFELAARHFRGLRRLEVRAQLSRLVCEKGGHLRDVRFNDVQVEEEAGRIQVGDLHSRSLCFSRVKAQP